MSTSIAFSPPTDAFLHLVEKAASDSRDKTISATEKPVTKLEFTSSCEDVRREFEKSYQDKIQPGSSIAAVFDPSKIESRWIPETFVLTEGSFRIPPKTSAVAIPLVKVGKPKIEYYNTHKVASLIDWDIGSIIYLGYDSGLKSDGCGNTSFIFLMFNMK